MKQRLIIYELDLNIAINSYTVGLDSMVLVTTFSHITATKPTGFFSYILTINY